MAKTRILTFYGGRHDKKKIVVDNKVRYLNMPIKDNFKDPSPRAYCLEFNGDH